jgi:hypothetical protein
MFRTLEADQAGITGMFGEGLAHWHAVSRVLRTHWYHVTFDVELEGRRTEIVSFMNDEHQLQEALISQDFSVSISEAQVVTPAYMNGGKGWLMETLKSVSLGQDGDGCTVCVIQVERGAVYHNSHRKGFDQISLTNLHEIYNTARVCRPRH